MRRIKREYGHDFADNPIEIVNIRVIGIGHMPKIDKLTAPEGTTLAKARVKTGQCVFRVNGELARSRPFSTGAICCPSARLSPVPRSCCRKTRPRSFRPAAPRPTTRPAISFSRSQGMPDERR